MTIKVSGFKSLLKYDGAISDLSKAFIEAVEDKLSEKLVFSELEDYDCDIKLIYIESGGSEGIFLENINSLKEPYYLLTNGSNNSLAASLEIMTYINLNGKKGEVIHGDIDYVADRIRTIALTNRVKNALAESKFGVIGKPSDWLIASVPSYEQAEKVLGVSFENIPLEEVKSEFNKAVICDTTGLPGEFNREEKLKAMRTCKAFKTIADRHKLSGFTVRCFD